jgi:two-component system sensor histidine kinase KdpD
MVNSDKKLLQVLITINSISNDKKLGFEQKLQHILLEMLGCMQAKRGSIMLLKGRKALEIVASTSEELIGITKRLDEYSPSTWVVQYKAPLYVDNIVKSDVFKKEFDHYNGSAFLLVPIVSNEKVIGVLNVTDKIGEDLFSKEEQGGLLDLAGQIISALENQRLTESLKKKRRTLQQKNLQLRKLEKLKTDLFNMLIHDLKGPISELMANLDILSYTLSDENQEYVDSAKTGCETLYSMVCNLLDIARLEDGRLDLVYEQTDPQELIKEALARLFGLGRMKELTFIEKIQSPETDGFFWGDRGLLLRVLQNLLTNAITYSPVGETIEVGFKYLAPMEIEFFVKDNGPGVPAGYQKAIFDKFVHLEKKSDGRIYTTGLGLCFCKMAVEAHSGEIGVDSSESKDSKGSRFYFIIPLERKMKN